MLTTDQWVAGHNAAWVALAIYTCWIYARHLPDEIRQKGLTDIALVMAGIAIGKLGEALHRAFWTPWRWARSADEPEIAAWFPEAADHTAGWAVFLILIGAMLCLRPVLKARCGVLWPLRVLGIAATGFFIGAYGHLALEQLMAWLRIS